MNKFIKKVLIFSTPIIIFIVLMEVLLREIPNDYSYKKNYLDTHSNEIETLFLGSSHTYRGINPEIIHSKSFNAAYVSQSIDYDLEILKKYENQTAKLKFIVIPIDYFSLYNRLETGVESWRIKNYTIYYCLKKEYKFKANFEILNGKLLENLIRIVNYKWNHKSSITSDKLGWGKLNFINNKDLMTAGKAVAKRHAKKQKSFYNENVAIVNEIISLAKAKNAKVIFYTSPAYKTYVYQLNKQQLQRTVTTITNIASSNTNVKYFNFLSDKSFDAKDFFDADHLNEIGAEKFSKKMDSIIMNLK